MTLLLLCLFLVSFCHSQLIRSEWSLDSSATCSGKSTNQVVSANSTCVLQGSLYSYLTFCGDGFGIFASVTSCPPTHPSHFSLVYVVPLDNCYRSTQTNSAMYSCPDYVANVPSSALAIVGTTALKAEFFGIDKCSEESFGGTTYRNITTCPLEDENTCTELITSSVKFSCSIFPSLTSAPETKKVISGTTIAIAVVAGLVVFCILVYLFVYRPEKNNLDLTTNSLYAKK